MKNHSNRQLSSLVVAIASVAALSPYALAQTTYVYTPPATSTTTDTWGGATANNTDWSAAPLSDPTATLTFGATGTLFAAGLGRHLGCGSEFHYHRSEYDLHLDGCLRQWLRLLRRACSHRGLHQHLCRQQSGSLHRGQVWSHWCRY